MEEIIDKNTALLAAVVELVDTHGSEPCDRKAMRVRVSPAANLVAYRLDRG